MIFLLDTENRFANNRSIDSINTNQWVQRKQNITLEPAPQIDGSKYFHNHSNHLLVTVRYRLLIDIDIHYSNAVRADIRCHKLEGRVFEVEWYNKLKWRKMRWF